MIYLPNLVFQFGLDLNVESQTWGGLRISAQTNYAQRQASIRTTHDPFAFDYVWLLCGRPPGRTQGQRLFVSRTVLCHGLRPVDLPRVPARHRGQSPRQSPSAVPHGLSLPDDFAQHAGQYKRHTALADLRRLCPAPNGHRQTFVSQRALGAETRCDSLRVGHQRHRFVSVGVCLGAISLYQGDHQAVHPDELAQQYSQLHSHYRRQDARGLHSGRFGARSRSILSDGSGLCGLRPAVRDSPGQGLLCDPCQAQHPIHAALFAFCGSRQYQGDLRSNGCADKLPVEQRLPNDAAPGGGQRRQGQTAGVSDQQLCLGARGDCRSVPPALAGGGVLQVDQTAFAYQGALWHQRERGQNADMDRHIYLSVDCYCEEASVSGASQPV
jgi:hypothetical protein